MIFKKALGFVLHVANSDPVFIGKPQFYALKERLLLKHGHWAGADLQHIVKTCWNCNGEGCRRCCSTGVYSQFWVALDRYDLGGYIFHRPNKRTAIKPNLPVTIKGYVQHERYPYYLSDEACYWLFLFYDRRAFWRTIGHCGHLSRKFTPMVILGSLLFNIRHRLPNKIHELRYKWQKVQPKTYQPDEEIPF